MFRAIAQYLSSAEELDWFQFENVVNLAAKPKKKGTQGSPKTEIGPSNLSAVCHILDKEADLVSHVWQLDARMFGSGQQRTRLYGSCFPRRGLYMPEETAHQLLNDTMNMLVGVQPCHPNEYLLGEQTELIKHERTMNVMKTLPEEAFLNANDMGLKIQSLFQSGGVLPCALNTGNKRRRVNNQHNSQKQLSCPIRAKWVQNHANAFRERGEEPWSLVVWMLFS